MRSRRTARSKLETVRTQTRKAIELHHPSGAILWIRDGTEGELLVRSAVGGHIHEEVQRPRSTVLEWLESGEIDYVDVEAVPRQTDDVLEVEA